MTKRIRWRWLLPVLLCLVVAALARQRVGAQGNPHGSLDLPCADCHTTEGWRPLADPLTFQHGQTGFPLTFGHTRVECRSCHQSLEFNRVATACADCHEDPHRGENGAACEDCHAPSGWDNRRAMWDRHNATLFPLVGAHAAADCAACHREAPPFEYSATPLDCYACHRADYEATSDPNHRQAGFPTDCETCHTPVAWELLRFGAGFDHDLLFPLTGAHRGLDCQLCHAAGFAGTPTDCYACHRADYEGTTDPNHRQAGFPTDCEACHTTTGWAGAVADHDQFFPLTGAHRGLDCELCHSNGFAGTPTDCVACHRAEYDQTKDPNHKQAGFSTDCEACHTTNQWQGAVFDHNQFFRLTGAHTSLDCEACHANGYAGTPTDCYACHKADYDQTKDPNHKQAGFPTDCEACHTTNKWEGATFDHNQFFVLTGAHTNLDCQACHANGYAGTPTDCYACHKADYQNANDPDHVAAGFPTDCELCHTTKNWDGANFTQHDSLYFPIYSGTHRNAWSSCQECHRVPANFALFECIDCHAHTKSETDREHREVNGYVYVSTACYECHPTGRAED